MVVLQLHLGDAAVSACSSRLQPCHAPLMHCHVPATEISFSSGSSSTAEIVMVTPQRKLADPRDMPKAVVSLCRGVQDKTAKKLDNCRFVG